MNDDDGDDDNDDDTIDDDDDDKVDYQDDDDDDDDNHHPKHIFNFSCIHHMGPPWTISTHHIFCLDDVSYFKGNYE